MIGPLLFLWAMSRAGKSAAPSPSMPNWPTTRSPPPPMPAFQPHHAKPKPKPATAAETPATALSTLHNAPPPPVPKGGAAPSVVDTVKRRATSAAKSAATNAARSALKSVHLPFGFGGGPHLTVKSVLELQKALNNWGGTLALDGKWGPKTAAAWSAAARKIGAPPDIKRNGPTTARVANQAWDMLSVPPIP